MTNSEKTVRKEVAKLVLAGFAANPSIGRWNHHRAALVRQAIQTATEFIEQLREVEKQEEGAE